MVRRGGLEPPQVSPPDPKSGASTNSAILASVLRPDIHKKSCYKYHLERMVTTYFSFPNVFHQVPHSYPFVLRRRLAKTEESGYCEQSEIHRRVLTHKN